jgi:hypothetical protein
MNANFRFKVVVVLCFSFVSIASAWQNDYFKSRDIQRIPIQNVTVDSDGTPVAGGDIPLQFRRLPLSEDRTYKRGTLVAQIKDKDGNLEDRFLAYPLNSEHSTQLRFVTENGPGCIWSISRSEEKKRLGSRAGIGGSSRPAQIIRVKWEETFAVGDGLLKGQILCADEHKSLVLSNLAPSRTSPTKTRIGGTVEFTYDDDPNDGK